MRRLGGGALALLLGACGAVPHPGGPPPRPSSRPPAIVAATPIPPVQTAERPDAADAAGAGLVAGPPVESLPITPRQAAAALEAFRLSCPALVQHTDMSGLTRGADWQPACSAAATADPVQAAGFFRQWFETVQVGDGRAFATGYYEPEIAAARRRQRGYEVPIYGRPDDLVDVDLGLFSDDLKGKRIRGRVDGTRLVPYFDRTEIEQGALDGRAPVLAWAADPVALFVLQIQGSGRLRLTDGSVMRIGYASQNGRAYTGIGALMKQRGLLGPGQTSMQGIVAWLHAHPDQGRDIMRENRSFVFFQEQQGAPRGALGLAVTGGVSAAADPKFVPLGAPVFLSLDRADASRLWIVQDTGGAIRGSNRFDTFWGAGDAAAAIAGGMAARGTAFLLLPIGTVARSGAPTP